MKRDELIRDGRYDRLPLWLKLIPTGLVKPQSKIVWATIADHLGDKDEAWPSIELIALESGIVKRAVCSAIDNLEAFGLLSRRRTRKSNRYTLHAPSGLLEAEDVIADAARPLNGKHLGLVKAKANDLIDVWLAGLTDERAIRAIESLGKKRANLQVVPRAGTFREEERDSENGSAPRAGTINRSENGNGGQFRERERLTVPRTGTSQRSENGNGNPRKEPKQGTASSQPPYPTPPAEMVGAGETIPSKDSHLHTLTEKQIERLLPEISKRLNLAKGILDWAKQAESLKKTLSGLPTDVKRAIRVMDLERALCSESWRDLKPALGLRLSKRFQNKLQEELGEALLRRAEAEQKCSADFWFDTWYDQSICSFRPSRTPSRSLLLPWLIWNVFPKARERFEVDEVYSCGDDIEYDAPAPAKLLPLEKKETLRQLWRKGLDAIDGLVPADGRDLWWEEAAALEVVERVRAKAVNQDLVAVPVAVEEQRDPELQGHKSDGSLDDLGAFLGRL